MAKITMSPVWNFSVNSEEARLILKALGGRLNTPEEIEAAKKLGDFFTIERAKEADSLADMMDKHAEAAQGVRVPANEASRNPRNRKIS